MLLHNKLHLIVKHAINSFLLFLLHDKLLSKKDFQEIYGILLMLEKLLLMKLFSPWNCNLGESRKPKLFVLLKEI